MRVQIGNRWLGEGEACFIIAEAGVNHNGDVKLAKKLIDVAQKAGADAVKFQTFRAESLVTATAEKAAYQKETTNPAESQFAMLKKLELSGRDFKTLFAYAQRQGIIFLSSPFDSDSADLLEALGVPAFKIASGEITNFPLLKHIAGKQKPVILSTGMSTIDEVAEALEVLRNEGSAEIILLHCVSGYPAKVEDMNLRAMATLKETFKLPVGLSDHTLGITMPIAAVALGACVIEKHFTLDKNLPGPDHRASLEPEELTQMVKAIRDVEAALGNGVKRPAKAELDTKRAARRSLVAAIDIPGGSVITREMLSIKRPGSGLAPRYLEEIIGRVTKEAIQRNELITRKALE